MHNSESHVIQQLLTNLSGLYFNTLYVTDFSSVWSVMTAL